MSFVFVKNVLRLPGQVEHIEYLPVDIGRMVLDELVSSALDGEDGVDRGL